MEDDPRGGQVLAPCDMETLAAARYIMRVPLERVLSVILTPAVQEQLAKLGEVYAIHHLEKRLASLDFYHDVTRGTGLAASFNPPIK